jgi:hypothetical protein
MNKKSKNSRLRKENEELIKANAALCKENKILKLKLDSCEIKLKAYKNYPLGNSNPSREKWVHQNFNKFWL